MNEASVYSCDFEARDDGVHRLVRGSGGNTVSIAARGGHMLVVLAGEPSSDLIVEALRTGLDEGWLRLSMKTLVDLTRYFGVIDWGSLTRMRNLAAWSSVEPEKSGVAYLIRNTEFGAIIKAISALFSHTRHRAFTDRADAIAWLTA